MTRESFKGWLLIAVCAVSLAAIWWQDSRWNHVCGLLETAQDEAQMAEAWHSSAGRELAMCGVPRAAERAAEKACAARRFNDTSVMCE